MQRPVGRLLGGLGAILSLAAAPPSPAKDGEETPQLSYHVPAGEAAGADAVYAPPWAEGATLHVAGDGVLMRDEPSNRGRRLRILPGGTRVHVVRGDAELRSEAGFVHRWVEVAVEDTRERGHVFGAFLTPLAIAADLDGDGRPEMATVAFTPEAQVVVRIASPDRAPQWLSFRVAGEAYLSHRGGTVTARLVPVREAGIALLRVFTGQAACADNRTTFISFLATSSDPVPRPRIALETFGLVDPPAFARTEERFHAESRSVMVRTQVTAEDDSGNVVNEEEQVKRYRLRDGVYVPIPIREGRR